MISQVMPDAAKKTSATELRERRKFLGARLEQSGISLSVLGERAKLSKAMLSRFVSGDRDLSAAAWTRVLVAIQELLAEDDARRKQERKKAEQAAAKLGALGQGITTGILAQLFKSDEQIAREKAELAEEGARIAKRMELLDNLVAIEKSTALRQLKNPKFAKQLLEHYFALIEWRQKLLDLEAQGYVMMPKAVEEERDQLKARVAELEQELARERANKAGDSPG